MHPCEVCGGTEVDFGGNCTRCGTHRGQQSYDVSAPGSGVPYGGPQSDAPYGGPQSGTPHSGPPYSGPPYSGAPYSGAPYSGPGYGGAGQGYQAPGYQQPAPPTPYQPAQPGHPAAAPARGRSLMVPLVALSAIAVILVIGIVAVVVVRAGRDEPGGVVIDECVVGTWRVVKQTEKYLLDNGGTAEYTVSEYPVILRADGTGHVDHNGTTLKAAVSGIPVTLVVNGKIDFEFRTSNNQYTESNFKVEGTTTTTVGNEQPTTEPLSVTARPATYTCSGNTMVQDTELSHTELRRA